MKNEPQRIPSAKKGRIPATGRKRARNFQPLEPRSGDTPVAGIGDRNVPAPCDPRSGFIRPKTLLSFLSLFAAIAFAALAATYPTWWTTRGVIQPTPGVATNDYAPATLGQLKWFATQAKAELDQHLPGGAGTEVTALVASFANNNNYLPANQGQGKNIAQPFYDRLRELGHAVNDPWTGNNANDFAPLLNGQLKSLFNFEFQDGVETHNKNTGGCVIGIPSGWPWPSVPNTLKDTDGDRHTDYFEIVIVGTDPNDNQSFPVIISGTVTYSGPQEEKIRIVVADVENGSIFDTRLKGYGTYYGYVPNRRSYNISAYVDGDDDGERTVYEDAGEYQFNAVQVADANITGVNISIQAGAMSQAPIWVSATPFIKRVESSRTAHTEGIPGFSSAGNHYRKVRITQEETWDVAWIYDGQDSGYYTEFEDNGEITTWHQAEFTVKSDCTSGWSLSAGHDLRTHYKYYIDGMTEPLIEDDSESVTWIADSELNNTPGITVWPYPNANYISTPPDQGAPPSISTDGITIESDTTASMTAGGISPYGSPITITTTITLSDQVESANLRADLINDLNDASAWQQAQWDGEVIRVRECGPDLNCRDLADGTPAPGISDRVACYYEPSAGSAAALKSKVIMQYEGEPTIAGREYRTRLVKYTINTSGEIVDKSVIEFSAIGDGELFLEFTEELVVEPPSGGCTYIATRWVDILEVRSDQIPGNTCNKLPTAFFKDEPNNPMLMATRSGNDAHLAIKASVPVRSAKLKAFVGVRRAWGGGPVINSAQILPSDEITHLQFNALNGLGISYEVVAGIDHNENGALDSAEVESVFEKTPNTNAKGIEQNSKSRYIDKIIVVNENQFLASKSEIIGYSVWGTDYAGDLIKAFGRGERTVPESSLSEPFTVSSASYGLSHKVGAKWDASCEDMTYKLTFIEGTEASNDFEESEALSQIIDSVIQNNLDSLIISASGSSWVESSAKSFSEEKDFNKTEDVIGFNELGLSFGKVTIPGQLVVIYRKTAPNSIEVSQVNVAGSFDDLYDFQYGGTDIRPKHAAAVQAGHATLSSSAVPSGKIHFTRLEFSTGWKSHSKTYNIPPP